MNRFMSTVVIALLSVACLSGAAQIPMAEVPRKQVSLEIACSEIPTLTLAAALQKDADLQAALAVADEDRTKMFIHLAHAVGLEKLMQFMEGIKCYES